MKIRIAFTIVFIVPIICGMLVCLLPAFSWLPTTPILANNDFFNLSLEPFRQLLNSSGVAKSLLISLVSAWLSCLLALLLAMLITFGCWQTHWLGWLNRWLGIALAIPHAAFAVALILLFAPSGWLLKALSPWLTGWDIPPTFSLVKHPSGISLIGVLMLKETPFFVLMILSQLSQIPVAQSLRQGIALGYSSNLVWLKVILPQLLPRLRLPIFAVLVYALSVVDVSLVVGPTAPPSFAVMVHHWLQHADNTLLFVGSAGAALLMGLCAVSMFAWWVIERVLLRANWFFWVNGVRQSTALHIMSRLAVPLFNLIVVIFAVAMLVLVVWSFTFRWQFPDFLPYSYSWQSWLKSSQALYPAILNSLQFAFFSTIISVALVVILLEKLKHRLQWLSQWMYFPLLIPQLSLAFGLQVIFLQLNISGSSFGVIWVHVLFVLPYVFLTLRDAYLSYDDRYSVHAMSLGRPYWRVLLFVKWPILFKPLMISMAVGLSVSIALYLPTLYVGEGRFDTLATEVVNVSSGSDPRRTANFALYQWLMAWLGFSLALVLPRWLFSQSK